jgi:aspartate/methionine/tyrosine aminotransferase
MRLADRMQDLGTEDAFRVFTRARALEERGCDVIHLEMGAPDFPTPDHVVEAAVAALRAGRTGYTAPAGLPVLREAIAEEVSRTRGVAVDPAQVVVCPGGKPVIFFAFLSLVGRGDEVVYPDPGFPVFESLASGLGAVRLPYPAGGTDGRRPDVDRIAERLSPRTRLLVLNSPGNPTGVVHRRDELERIAQLVRDRDVVVLSDEIYSRFVYDGRHESLLSLPGMAERTVLLDGFSKTWNMSGWRLGWAVAPRALAAAFERWMTNSVSCAVSFVQEAAVAALRGPDDDLARRVAAFRERRDVLADGLDRLPGVRCSRPEGALFAFADVRGTGWDAAALAEALREREGVACVPGPAFGAAGAGRLRFSLTASVARIQEALGRFARLLGG